MRNSNRTRKRIIIISVIIFLTALIGIGTWLFVQYQNDQKTVEVIPVSDAMSYYWGDETYSSGTVMSDYIQEIYYEPDKQISEIFVKEGDPVKIGDPLLQYDKTKLELDVERTKLEIQSVDEKISTAQNQLRRLQNTKPSTNPTAPPPVIIDPTDPEDPTPTPSPTPIPIPTPDPNVVVHDVIDDNAVPYKGKGTTDDPYVYLIKPSTKITPGFLQKLFGLEPRPDPDDPASMIYSPFAAVFEVREGNSNYGKLISSFMLDGTTGGGGIDVPEIPEIPDGDDNLIEWGSDANAFSATPTPSPSPTPNANNYDDMGYTSDELKELIAEKQEEIATLQIQKKQTDLNLKRAELLLKNSTLLSNIDGVVNTLLDPQEAAQSSKPFLTVTGEAAFYLHGSISENLLGSVNVGDTVSAMSWETQTTYNAQIVSIDDYPLEGSYSYGAGNPNSSNYEFLAVLDNTDGLYNNMYLEITMQVTDESSEDALYLQMMYVRDDDSGSYVMMAGPDEGRLIKRYVETGKIIDGGYAVEIISGLTASDYIAFPYGKDVKEGVRTVIQGQEETPVVSGDDLPAYEVPTDDDADENTDDVIDGDSGGKEVMLR